MGAEEEQLEVKLEKEEQSRTNPNPNPKPKSITESQFLSWKRQRDASVSAQKEEASRKRAEDVIAGTVPMNGRELFLHEPEVFDNSRY